MKRGPKPRKDQQTGASTRPVMPDYLDAMPAAQAVWFEEIEHVVGAGITASHASTFARYCSMEAACRSVFAKGAMPQAAMLTEVRKLAELLGIGGLSSRTSTGSSNPLTDVNPYAALPDA